MFDKKYEDFIFSLFMSLFISAIMSFAISVINLGFKEDMLFIWLNAYWKSFVLAFPITYFANPIVRKIIKKIIKE